MSVTKRHLTQYVATINQRLAREQIRLLHLSHSRRVTRAHYPYQIEAGGRGRAITDYLSGEECRVFLEGFLTALMLAEEAQGSPEKGSL